MASQIVYSSSILNTENIMKVWCSADSQKQQFCENFGSDFYLLPLKEVNTARHRLQTTATAIYFQLNYHKWCLFFGSE